MKVFEALVFLCDSYERGIRVCLFWEPLRNGQVFASRRYQSAVSMAYRGRPEQVTADCIRQTSMHIEEMTWLEMYMQNTRAWVDRNLESLLQGATLIAYGKYSTYRNKWRRNSLKLRVETSGTTVNYLVMTSWYARIPSIAKALLLERVLWGGSGED